MEKDRIYYMYILLCQDGTLYTGYTTDLVKRIKTHNNGHGAKYTRNRIPVKLIYWEKFATKKEAMQREYAIKQWNRQDKLLLLEEKRNLVEGLKK